MIIQVCAKVWYRDDSDPRKGGFGGVTELVSELVVILLGNVNP